MNIVTGLALWTIGMFVILMMAVWIMQRHPEGTFWIKSLRLWPTICWSLICSVWLLVDPARESAKINSYGIPIVQQSKNLDGHTFNPSAFTITEHRILVYDKDEKVYALDGIKLEDGLKPETLTVGTNISYTVYTKAGQLYFGRLDHPKPEKS